jgi:predicted signal transduction protein with EAL and GGDEF domain
MVTVSVGVAALPTHGTSPQELLDAADAALYCAKTEGRDRAVIASRRDVGCNVSAGSVANVEVTGAGG